MNGNLSKIELSSKNEFFYKRITILGNLKVNNTKKARIFAYLLLLIFFLIVVSNK